MKSINETVMKFVFLAAACTSVLAVALICIFLFANGIPAMAKIGLPDFLFGMKWKPSNGLYGIFPFILGSIYVTAGAIVVGVPTAFCLQSSLHFIVRKAVCTIKGNGKPPCRNPICCLWIFRFDSVCPIASTAYRS